MLTNKICARHITTLSQTDLPLSIPICCPWTSLGNTVFTQIVSSYNYERLIRSISTPNVYALFVLLYSYLYFYAPFTYPLYSYSPFLPLFTYTLYSYLYLYASILTPLFLLPTTLPSICTHNMYAFFLKNFPKKISTPKSVP